VTDSLADADAAIDCAPDVLPTTIAPGASVSCTTAHTLTQADIDAGSVVNTAAVTAEDPAGTPVTDDSDDPNDPANVDPDGDGEPDDPTTTALLGDAQLEVTKIDILAGTGVVGDTITYTITTTNSGLVTLSNIDLTDTLADADASLDCLPTVLPATLAPGGSLTCTAVHTLVQADIDAGEVVNIVRATAEDPAGNAVADDSDDPDEPTDVDPDGDGEPDDPTITELTASNRLQLIKTASSPTTAGEGDPIDYTFVIVNTGLTTLSNVGLVDPILDAGSVDCGIAVLPATMAPADSITCTGTHSITAADLAAEFVVNSAITEGLSPVGDLVVDTSDDPTDPTNLDDNTDGEPDDPTVITLIPPVAPGNTVLVNEPASPDRPVVIDVVSDDSDADGSIDATSVNLIGGTDTDGDGNTDILVIPGEGTWSVDRVTGDISFVPEPGFTANPAPILYTVADDQGIVSEPGTVRIDYPPVAVDDTSVDNPFGTRVVVNVVSNDTAGDTVIPATLSLVGGTDTDADGYADQLVVAGEGVWRTNNVAGRVSFKPDAGFVGDPTPVDYLILDIDGRPTQAAVVVAYQPQPTTSIEGTVFNDKNANNVQDADEPDLSGVSVTLTCAGPDGLMGTGDDVVASAVTASPYQFSGVVVGDTCVIEITGGLASFPIQTADPDNNRDGKTTVTVGGTLTNLNFGFRAAPMLSVTGTNSLPLTVIALLLILIGGAMVILPGRIEDWREPEYW